MDHSIQSVINNVRKFVLPISVALLVSGCRFGQLPNPNAQTVSDKYDGESLQKRVMNVGQTLSERVMRGEMDDVTRESALRDYIKKELSGIEIEKVGVDQAWRFADVYRQIDEWETTQRLYKIAVKYAPDEDRRVNDTIRLAEAEAKLDNVVKGIDLVRSTFNAQPGGKAPILLATLYEFAPAALGKGQDVEVAILIEEAIGQHLLTIVDPESEPGRAFIKARHHHIERAWQTVLGILREKGSQEQLMDALEKSNDTLGRFTRI